jgi:hypothetical protein
MSRRAGEGPPWDPCEEALVRFSGPQAEHPGKLVEKMDKNGSHVVNLPPSDSRNP